MTRTSRSTWTQACTLASFLLLPSFVAGALPVVSVSNFSSTPADNANKIKDNFLGISWELSSFNTLWGETADALPVSMQNYLANIRARMSSDLRIRVGGNSMDSSTYDPSQSVMIKILDDSYYNNVPVTFGPLFFDVINGMSDKIGGMQVISGLSMQDPANDSNVITLAEASRQKLGSKLDALTLGNEPDLYAGHGTRVNYTISDYIPEIQKVLDDFNNSYSDILSSPVIAGPTVCCSWDLATVLNAGLKNYDYKYYTIQHYPNNVCSGQTPATSNLTYYLTHANVAPYISWNDDGMTLAAQQGREVLLTEYNTASCGGDPNVGPTFAATLWAVDVALTAATLNFSAVYLHTREYGITYNLFDPPLSNSSAVIPSVNDTLDSNWRTGSPYYATLVLAEAISNSSTGSVVADLNLDNSINDQSASVAGYGIWDSGKRGKLVLFNFANASSEEDGGAQGSERTFTIPEGYASSTDIQVRYLLGTNTTEHTNISWANQTVQQNGILQGTQYTQSLGCSKGCNVTVPGPGLALVLLSDSTDKFYVGNSTVTASGVGDTDSSSSGKSSAGLMKSVWTGGMGLVVISLAAGLVGLS